MIDLIMDLLEVFSFKFHIRRIPFRDRVANNWAAIRYRFIRFFLPSLMSDWSEPEKEGYTLVFQENFNTLNWDRYGEDKWRIGEGWGMWHPKKPNVYYGAPEVDTANGVAKFTCKYNPREFPTEAQGKITIPYEVSLLSSDGWFRKKYGRFECRMTLPDAPYSFPAFWLWGAPPYGEIDVIEGKGRRTGKTVVFQHMNLHRVEEDGVWRHLRTSVVKIDDIKRFPGKFYEFAVEWTPDRIEIFTNGIKVFQYTKKEVLSKNFAHPMWIIINNSIHPMFDKHDPNYYSEFCVDYIRVYDIDRETYEKGIDINKNKVTMEKVNINRATVEQLQTLPHIGPKRAQKIINRRPYRDVYELSNVLGLGKKRMDDILPHVTT